MSIIHGDCLTILRSHFADQSVQCCVTSPPYWGLRDYGVEGQLGLESTPELYVSKLVEVFREVRRVLKDDGTLWLNLGDSYNSACDLTRNDEKAAKGLRDLPRQYRKSECNLKPKDLCGIPWRVAFAMQADGWYLRSDIIWAKPNPMPESVTDRPTKAHEYLFLLSKSERYYYDQDAIAEPITDSSQERLTQPSLAQQEGSWRVPFKTNGAMKAVGTPRNDGERWNENNGRGFCGNGMRNKRSIWTIATQPYAEAHFATFPPKLIEPCILAGCPSGGLVLDPFAGSGTTIAVAQQLGRRGVGIELNPAYIELAAHRTAQEGLPL